MKAHAAEAQQLRSAIRTLARLQPRRVPRNTLTQQPFDGLLLTRSALYERTRTRYVEQGGTLEAALLSSPRSLGSTILLENRIQYSPIADELLFTALDTRESPERLLELRTFTTSLFHEQNHRLLWNFLPPPAPDADSIRKYLNFIESLVVMTDMALSDGLGPKLARPLYLVGSVYDPGSTALRDLKSGRAYRQYLLIALYATFLNLELYEPEDVKKIIVACFGKSPAVARATQRALNLDRRFVLNTNPVWQHRNRKAITQFFARKARTSKQHLNLGDDPFQHGLATLWAERWLDEMKVH